MNDYVFIVNEEYEKELLKRGGAERKKKELDKEFDPSSNALPRGFDPSYYVPSTQACLPEEYKTLSNNPYITPCSKHYFTDEDVEYNK